MYLGAPPFQIQNKKMQGVEGEVPGGGGRGGVFGLKEEGEG